MTIPRQIFLRMRNVIDKSCWENQHTHFMFNNFFPKIAPFFDKVEKYGGARGAINDVTMWRICLAWISKATCTHAHVQSTRSGTYTYVRTRTRTHRQICNTYRFSTATIIREIVLMLRYTYIACLVLNTETFKAHWNC